MSTSRRAQGRRWLVVGDPQTELAKLLSVLRHHGLLEGERLRHEVGLVSMGDHFDFGEPAQGDHARFAAEGEAVLTWLASHPRDQVRILVGNHDLARVQELAPLDDADFAEARALAAEPEGAEELRRRFPSVPTPGVVLRDFSGFSAAQRALVQRLLVERRLDWVLVGRLGGRDCLLSHAGVTRRELGLLGLPEGLPVVELARALAGWLEARVAAVAPAWRRGERTALDLSPLHHAGVAGAEAGGLFAARPANPGRPGIAHAAWEWDEARPRRFDPRHLVPGVLQVVGHTGHGRLRRELVPWVDAELGATHEPHSLELRPEGPRYRRGFDPTVGTAVLFTDAKLHDAPVSLPLLELEAAPARAAGSGSVLGMPCARCDHQNPFGSKFCNQCGSPLPAARQIAMALVEDGMLVHARLGEPVSDLPGERSWITILDENEPDEAYGDWRYVDEGVSEVAVPRPKRPGRYEVRLHGGYPRRSHEVVARASLVVEAVPRPPAPVRFSLGATEVGPEAAIPVRFERPVPSTETERYWINVVYAWERDDEWGDWQYVPDGATELELRAPRQPGSYEVRLYFCYPTLLARLAQRGEVDVVA